MSLNVLFKDKVRSGIMLMEHYLNAFVTLNNDVFLATIFFPLEGLIAACIVVSGSVVAPNRNHLCYRP